MVMSLEILGPIQKILKNRYFSFFFCSILSVIILFFGLSIGPMFSPDSIGYLSTANAIPKQGLLEYLLSWTISTPLFPLLILFGGYLFGGDLVFSAHIITVLSFALLMFPVFYLGKEIGNEYVGYCSCIFIATSRIPWNLSTMIWTEMPYILFSSIALAFLVKYIKNNQYPYLLLGAAFIALTSMERYIGIFLVITSVGIIFIYEIILKKGNIRRFLVFLLISATPIFLLIVRNIVCGQDRFYAFHSRTEPLMDLFIETVYYKINGILPGVTMPDYSAFFFLFALLLLIIVPFGFITGIHVPKKEVRDFVLTTSPVWAYIIFFILFFEIFYLSWQGFGEHERLQIVIIPLLLVLLFAILSFNLNVLLPKKSYKICYILFLLIFFSFGLLSQIYSLPYIYKNLDTGLGDFACNRVGQDIMEDGVACTTDEWERVMVNPFYKYMSSGFNDLPI